MNDLLDLFHLIKSRVPLIIIETRDEKDVLLLITEIGKSMRTKVYGWDVIRGFSLLDNTGNIKGGNLLEPREVLLSIYNTSLAGIFILLDFHPYLENDRNIRLLKELASNAERLKQTIILVSAQIDLPNGQLSGLKNATEVLAGVEGVAFDVTDIVQQIRPGPVARDLELPGIRVQADHLAGLSGQPDGNGSGAAI